MRITAELNDIIRSDTKTFGESRDMFMVQTGFDCFDYLNGQILLNKDGSQTKNVGIDAGKLVTVIGKSGSGKTTFAIQMGANIIRRYDESTMYFLDFEQGTSEERIRMVTGMDEDEFAEKVILKQSGIGTETVLQLVLKLAKFKQAHKKELLVPNKEGILDADGRTKLILPPSVIIVDSIAAMQPLSINDDEEIKGQMTATTTAKLNTQLFKRIGMPCADANIIVIFVNHINKKIETTIVPTQAQVNYLAQDETLPGGNACIYLTNTLIRITTASKLEEDKTYKIKGFMAKVSLVKSRTAEAGRSRDFVYNQVEGFDNELSLLEFIKSNGYLLGAGVSYKLKGLETHTFNLGNFKEKLKTDNELRDYFYTLGRELLEKSLKVSSKFDVREPEIEEVAEEISGIDLDEEGEGENE